MDRALFLEKCKQCAVLEEYGHTKKVPRDLMVEADGCVYYPVGYELKFDNQGNATHTAILHDLIAHSVTYYPLAKVVEING